MRRAVRRARRPRRQRREQPGPAPAVRGPRPGRNARVLARRVPQVPPVRRRPQPPREQGVRRAPVAGRVRDRSPPHRRVLPARRLPLPDRHLPRRAAAAVQQRAPDLHRDHPPAPEVPPAALPRRPTHRADHARPGRVRADRARRVRARHRMPVAVPAPRAAVLPAAVLRVGRQAPRAQPPARPRLPRRPQPAARPTGRPHPPPARVFPLACSSTSRPTRPTCPAARPVT